jgi:hypothetical protein
MLLFRVINKTHKVFFFCFFSNWLFISFYRLLLTTGYYLATYSATFLYFFGYILGFRLLFHTILLWRTSTITLNYTNQTGVRNFVGNIAGARNPYLPQIHRRRPSVVRRILKPGNFRKEFVSLYGSQVKSRFILVFGILYLFCYFFGADKIRRMSMYVCLSLVLYQDPSRGYSASSYVVGWRCPSVPTTVCHCRWNQDPPKRSLLGNWRHGAKKNCTTDAHIFYQNASGHIK